MNTNQTFIDEFKKSHHDCDTLTELISHAYNLYIQGLRKNILIDKFNEYSKYLNLIVPEYDSHSESESELQHIVLNIYLFSSSLLYKNFTLLNSKMKSLLT